MLDDLDAMTELYPVWKQALVRFKEAGFVYGDIVPHDWFHEAFGLPSAADQAKLSVPQYQAVRLKRLGSFEPLQAALLNDHGIDLQTEPGVGYRLVHPRDQVRRAYEDGQRAIKKAIRDMTDRGVVNVNTGALTADERRANADIQARIGMLRGLLRPPRELPELDSGE